MRLKHLKNKNILLNSKIGSGMICVAHFSFFQKVSGQQRNSSFTQ